MLLTTSKGYYLRIILLLTSFFLIVNSSFGLSSEGEAGPVISSVNINSCVGSISISATSGVLPYTYEWKDNMGNVLPFTSFIASGLTAGNYTVEVTDANGDTTGPATYTVTNPPDLVGTVVVNDVTCRGDSDAQVVVTMGNGNPGYDWELFNGGGVSVGTGAVAFPNQVITLTGLGIGSYTLSTADQDGCTGDITFTITEPANFLGYSLGSSTDATCFNATDGSISVTGTGGWGNYTYRWIRVSNGAVIGSAATITGLAPGGYQLDIIDRGGTGCTISTPVLTIDAPDEIIPTAVITDALCNGDANGAINLSVTGGVGPFTYSWSNGVTTQDINGLSAGAYTVTVTDNAGCTDVETFTVNEPAVLIINPVITDVDCFGDNSGRIRSNVTGGTGPYTYAWSTGNTGTNLNNRVAGTYALTVTDANGCVATAMGLTIVEPAMALSKLTDALTDPSCFGSSDGTVSLTMQGGTAPYSYAWSNGDNTAMASTLTAGIHTVTVTDAAGCTYTENFTLNNPLSIAVSPSLTLPTCNAGADGSITVVASNGTGPYTYNWNTGDSGPTVNGLVAGSYTVTVSDAGGCSVIETIVLGEPAVLTGNAVVNDISCNGSTDGSIFLSVAGGTGPYTFVWSNGATVSNISGLSAGGYTVTITDASGCSIVENYNIIDPPPIGLTFTQVDVVCKGASTGAIDITPSGGTAPYSYLWSNGSTSQDLNNVPAGAYSVSVKDASNCAVNLNVTITEPALVLNLSGSTTNATCNGSDNGVIDLSVTGGSGPYTYAWNTGAVTEDISGLAPGNYAVSVTDANGCIKALGFTIAEPAPLTGSATKTDISCNGANDGTITLSISGGTGPFTYSWADDLSVLTKDRTSLSSGNYTVTVTDANGCQDVESITINEPLQLASTDVIANVNCFGENTGSINISVSGGVSPYSFSWSNGALTEDLVNVPAGNYNVVITDSNGCSLNDSFTITEPSAPLAKTEAVQQITCNGAADGIINLTVTGGSAPYTYSWSNGSTSEDLNSLSAGNYTVVITDNNGCTITDSYVITDPPVLSMANTVNDITCFGANDGDIDITTIGGEGPYTYAWSNGEITEDITGLSAGNYSVNITDTRGCTTSQNFIIQEPAQLSLIYSVNDVSCFGLADGTTDITVSGGSAPYSYSWSNGAVSEDLNSLLANNYTVTVTDANGCTINETIAITQPSAPLSTITTVTDISCFGGSDGSLQLAPAGGTAPYSYNWNTGSTNKDIFGLSDGSYQVTITDANGCSIVENYSITMPTAMQVSGSQVNVLCNGESSGGIDLTVSGGTGPYTYSWSNGANTEDLSSILAGNYNVVVSDARGCVINRSFTVTEPLAVNVVDNIVDVSCFGDANGSIDLSVSGGIAPYTYAWSNGETTQDLFNISGGSYSLIITDGNACQTTVTYIVDEPTTALSVSGIVNDENCFGDSQGAVQLTVAGGTAPYSYLWNQGTTTKDINGLSQGNYQVTVTDNNGCSIQGNFTITGPMAVSAVAAVSDITCNGQNDGVIDLLPAGGVGPYSFVWSDGDVNEDRTNLSPGNYGVTITDANGCSTFRNYTITEPLAINVVDNIVDVSCFGDTNGSIDVSVSGGITPYSYAWSNGETTQDLVSISGGSYTLIVTDGNGCQFTNTYTVDEPTAGLGVIGVVTDENCFDDSQGAVQLTVSGGTAPYTYAWNQGSTTKDVSGLGRGNYQVTITDLNGCTTQGNFTVSSPPPMTASALVTDITCNGQNDGMIDLLPAGGVGPYTFLWSDGDVNEDRTNLSPGNYSVTITDANGCAIFRSYTVTEPAALAIGYAAVDVTCFGEANGNITVSVSGGSLPYSYAWSSGEITKDLNNISGGTYTLTVTDNNGCQTMETIVVEEPVAALTVTATVTDESCFGDNQGAIVLNVNGGTGPYTYAWNQGSSAKDIFGLGSGNYQVIITDLNGCTTIGNFAISSPPPMTASALVTDATCNSQNDGMIDLLPAGGVGPYSFVWSDGDVNEDRTALSPGNYGVTITDANGCSTFRNYTITEPLAINVVDNIVDVSCFGDTNGSIDVSVSGGITPYSYTWSNGETTQDLVSISGGNYTLIVTDGNGCQFTNTYSVHEPAAALGVTGVVTDENCYDDSQGAIQLTVSGGTAPYTYAWNQGSTTKDVSGLGRGNYQVTITDLNGCTTQGNFSVSSPPPITASALVTDITCNGQNDGTIDLQFSGGTGAFSFAWSDGETSEDRTALSPGNYGVTITDANSCSIFRSYTVTEPAALAIGYAAVDVTCFGEANGNITVSVSGGSLPYSYAWSSGETTKDLNSISGGTYTLTVTDNNGCQTMETIVVEEPIAALTVTATVTDESCFGDNQGAIALNVNGGTGPYTYTWNQGSSAKDIFGLGRGAYQVTITDAKGCSIQSVFTVAGPSALSISSGANMISCFGADDGDIDITMSGGTAPYTYAWSNGEATEDVSGLVPATYAVLVTDANGCTTSANFTITEPLPLAINYQADDVSCFGADDGNIALTITGGTLPYSYLWDNGETTKDLSSLTGGNYEITVRDARGCLLSTNITIGAPTAALSATPTISDALCNGQPDGKIELNVTGGTAPFNYAWSNGSNQKDLINVFAGSYGLTITDAGGCVFSQTYEVQEPAALDIDFEATSTSCFGDADGAVVVTPSGGTGPYAFVWSNGSTSKDLVNISGGTYNLTIVDSNNCSITRAVVVGDSRDLTVDIQKRDVLCRGESSGFISLDVTGGSGSYTYTWNTGDSASQLNDLAAGVYEVVISDEGGCSTAASVVISEPAEALSVQLADFEDLRCFGDQSALISAVPSGGIAPYTYLWSNGARTNQITGLGAGDYSVVVTDANGCAVQLVVTIAQPLAPITIATSGKLNLSCTSDNDGQINIDLSGGTGPYEILWSTGANDTSISGLRAGEYTVSVRDAMDCIVERVFTVSEPELLSLEDAIVNESQCYDDRNGAIELNLKGGTAPFTYQWNTGATTKNLIGISSGEYAVLVTDANGCQVEGNYSLSEPALYRLSSELSPISCIGANDASISLNIEGGVGSSTILWNTGASSETLTNLGPGVYNVLVADKNGCTIQRTFNVFDPLPLTLDAYIEEATRCNDPRSGRVNVIVSGGNEPYSYRWTNGATSSSLIDVLPGTYVVEVTDRYNCTVQGTYTVLQPAPLQVGFSTEPYIDCENRIAGMLVKADVKGGVGKYQFTWSRGNSVNSELLVTEPGRLSIEVSDDRGCFQQRSIDIDIPELGLADFKYNAESIDLTGELASNDPVSFFDLSVGEVVDWKWEFGDGFESNEIDPIHTYDSPGTYNVILTITDRTGCETVKTSILEITEGYRIMLPNAFTPNGDGNNDFFRPRMLGLTKVQLSIYNTWGEVIFSTDDLETKGWDGTVNGKRAENGNYIYKLTGLSFNGLKVERDGIFALMK